MKQEKQNFLFQAYLSSAQAKLNQHKMKLCYQSIVHIFSNSHLVVICNGVKLPRNTNQYPKKGLYASTLSSTLSMFLVSRK
jgi:hypothetical protein